eukprot:TRINITY_DN452_c0_g1_i4.p1 TRINITY_DN452_c0_g1~~TRINITY_DN452_c0_g1_i4.p1  ORF type:complete len:357 (+),score=97.30 TRINITY_DN452_c0_g1_i4:91-1071(+)
MGQCCGTALPADLAPSGSPAAPARAAEAIAALDAQHSAADGTTACGSSHSPVSEAEGPAAAGAPQAVHEGVLLAPQGPGQGIDALLASGTRSAVLRAAHVRDYLLYARGGPRVVRMRIPGAVLAESPVCTPKARSRELTAAASPVATPPPRSECVSSAGLTHSPPVVPEPPTAAASSAPELSCPAKFAVLGVAVADSRDGRTQFRIECEDPAGQQRGVLRFYTDFRTFRKQLAAADCAVDAPFPGKTLGRPSGTALETRRQGLEQWMIRAAEKHGAVPLFADFLSEGEHVRGSGGRSVGAASPSPSTGGSDREPGTPPLPQVVEQP